MSNATSENKQDAQLAIWNGIQPGHEREFELWHSHIHLIQKRDSGILKSGARYVSPGDKAPSYFTLYESDTPSKFGPAGYATVSPTLDTDKRVRKTFIDFVRGVFVIHASAGEGTASGWLVTLQFTASTARAELDQYAAAALKLAGADGVVQVQLSTYDAETTTSFTLRNDPRPTLPTSPYLLLLRGLDRPSLEAAVERFKSALTALSSEVQFDAPQVFTLQHEFRL
ncbi:MAG: hypothetical protein ACRYG5_07965 [Janthinobacterium lividum]